MRHTVTPSLYIPRPTRTVSMSPSSGSASRAISCCRKLMPSVMSEKLSAGLLYSAPVFHSRDEATISLHVSASFCRSRESDSMMETPTEPWFFASLEAMAAPGCRRLRTRGWITGSFCTLTA